LKTNPQKLPNLQWWEKTWWRTSKYKRHKIGVIEILRREGKENGANEILEIKMSQIFPK
jgi:hypothetical protein